VIGGIVELSGRTGGELPGIANRSLQRSNDIRIEGLRLLVAVSTDRLRCEAIVAVAVFADGLPGSRFR